MFDRETANSLWEAHLKASRGIPVQPELTLERERENPTKVLIGLLMVMASACVFVTGIACLIRLLT